MEEEVRELKLQLKRKDELLEMQQDEQAQRELALISGASNLSTDFAAHTHPPIPGQTLDDISLSEEELLLYFEQ